MGEFERRIEEARDDPVALKQVADELLEAGDQSLRALGIKALVLRAKALKNHSGGRPPPAVRSEATPQANWLAQFGLPHPDGRPLYRYKLPAAVFSQLQKHLAERASDMRYSATKAEAALFVLWAAEWFRRSYQGGIQRWDDVGRPINLRCNDWHGWKRLADTGLKFWSIPELWINGTHHRLAAIARQGGFPVAALEGGTTGWAARYLKQLVGHLLSEADPSLDAADRHAERLFGSIPELWRSDEMRVVSAELALEVVRLRREAESGGAISGSLVSTWLDQFRSGWRDELPLPVDGDAARALIDDLLRVVPLKGGSGSISVSRCLRICGDKRVELAKLDLNGMVESPVGRTAFKLLADQWSRLRMFASGVFGQYASGELAMAEPAEDDRWVARSTAVRTDLEVPFAVPILVELRGEGRRACDPFLLPGGDRVGDSLRVFAANSEGEELSELVLVGSGSGRYRAEPLYLDVPPGWSVVEHDDVSTCAMVHRSPDGRELWNTAGAARVISDRSDTYLVRAGQTGDKRDTLSLIGSTPRGCAHEDPTTPLYLGVPRLEVSDGGRPRSPAPGESWWRRKGETTWRPLGGSNPDGLVEFAWRDASTGHMRDRKDAVVLPDRFEVIRSIGPSGITISVSGWSGEIELGHGVSTEPCTWRFNKGSKRHSTWARLRTAEGQEIRLVLPLPHSASLAHWNDGPLEPNERISLSTISRFVARAEGRCELLADLIDRQGRKVGERRTSWWMDGELPLSAVRDDVAALLRPLGDIDARVVLDFNDANEEWWYISEFELDLTFEGRGLVPTRAVPEGGSRVVGRALSGPATEREFCTYGLAENLNHRPIELPKLEGDWLVYLRQEDRVLSRPIFIVGESSGAQPTSELGRAMAERNPFARDEALRRMSKQIAADPSASGSRATIKDIIDLALSLNGLPPATFDVFLKLEFEPLLGPLLLFQAAPTELELLIRLADGLPFCWETIPKRYWDTAAEVEFRALNEAMPNSIELCAKAVGDRRREIASLEPALSPLLDLSTPQLGLHEAAQSFLNRSGDRVPEHTTSPFRPALSCLPDWRVSSHFLRDLDAPVAAALAAKETIELDPEHVYCIKDVARRHPRYFREAFAAAFREQ